MIVSLTPKEQEVVKLALDSLIIELYGQTKPERVEIVKVAKRLLKNKI